MNTRRHVHGGRKEKSTKERRFWHTETSSARKGKEESLHKVKGESRSKIWGQYLSLSLVSSCWRRKGENLTVWTFNQKVTLLKRPFSTTRLTNLCPTYCFFLLHGRKNFRSTKLRSHKLFHNLFVMWKSLSNIVFYNTVRVIKWFDYNCLENSLPWTDPLVILVYFWALQLV